MEEMDADVLARGLFREPSLGGGAIGDVVPELIHQLDTERDVPEHFTVERVALGESFFGVLVFPELAAVVEKHTREHQVAIQLGVDATDRIGGTHHLSDVFGESSTAGVVVFSRRGGTAKASAVFLQEVIC